MMKLLHLQIKYYNNIIDLYASLRTITVLYYTDNMKNQYELQELQYRDSVRRLFQLNSKQRFLNGSPWHAAYIYEAMLKYLQLPCHENKQDMLKIFCRDLNPSVFNIPFLKDLIIQNKDKVQIIIQSSQDDLDIDYFDKIKDRCLFATKEFEQIKQIKYNFATRGSAFRFEPSRDTVCAVASANEDNTAVMLREEFDRYWQELSRDKA